MTINPLFATDFYKVDHRRQYLEGTTEIYSNFTPRYVLPCKNLLDDFDGQVVMFGLQYFIKEYLLNTWSLGFFSRDKSTVINEYQQMISNALNLDDFNCSHLEALHDLGYLPIRIKAIDEGFRVPIGVPLLTIVNTHPDFFWLTNYLETAISATLWKPITVATIAFEFKRLLTRFAKLTGVHDGFVQFQAHDFSFRGMSGIEDAMICGSAHLTSFMGTDCIGAIDLLDKYYSGHACQIIGSSVPATEHSCMTCTGEEGEFDTIKRLITKVYPEGIVSIVCDSYDFWRVITDYLQRLYPDIVNRNGKVVIRPDSGDPFKIICGDDDAPMGSPENVGLLSYLWSIFGGITNKEGFRELNTHIGIIYGDAITVDVAHKILTWLYEHKFASSNIVFGVGSFSYQYLTRDTFGFAMKATSAVINDERVAIFKNPKTGSKKKSAKGLLHVECDTETARFKLRDNVSEEDENMGCLETVFEDGCMIQQTNLKKIRNTLSIELEQCDVT
jgi:nicotinamide phosphoribosyltransferase